MKRHAVVLPAVATALLVLLGSLAWLQYQWLGQISNAERERMQANLQTRATQYAQDFDRLITQAYFAFQIVPMVDGPADPLYAQRYQGWKEDGDPRLVRDVYRADVRGADVTLRRLNPATGALEPAEWPPELVGWRTTVRDAAKTPEAASPGTLRVPPTMPIEDSAPALIIPIPRMHVVQSSGEGDLRLERFEFVRIAAHTVVLLDRDYITREVLPALTSRYFTAAGGLEYHVAVLSRSGAVVYASSTSAPADMQSSADVKADLFAVRFDDIDHLRPDLRGGTRGRLAISVFQERSIATGQAPAVLRLGRAEPRWQLALKHKSGSLEAAVSRVRRRNLMISSSVLLLLGASLVMITVSSQRAQRLASQQMEFVAGVSHELRTPLAVIRSAADNLADGVIQDEERIRKYGELVRSEGRRLSEMVEQILEFAGIHSGARTFALRPVAVAPLLQESVASESVLGEEQRVTIELDVPTDLPAVIGDEPALRRVFQNLIGNAIKYGAQGGWVGVSARAAGSTVRVTVADRGIGIAAADHSRIFDPFYRAADVVEARLQGAGLGLSLVQQLVEAHGGQVSVKSQPGQGSAFTVVLPAALSERRETAARAEGVQAADPRNT
jgi:signal transduction histidine kinase